MSAHKLSAFSRQVGDSEQSIQDFAKGVRKHVTCSGIFVTAVCKTYNDLHSTAGEVEEAARAQLELSVQRGPVGWYSDPQAAKKFEQRLVVESFRGRRKTGDFAVRLSCDGTHVVQVNAATP